MMKILLLLFTLGIFFVNCTQQKRNFTKIDKAWLDSIIVHSDSSYTKPYYRTDYVTAQYYVNKKDSTLCQLMKDSAGITRQIIITKKDIRTFWGQYYINGQLQAYFPLDNFGHYNGVATYYYKNGNTQGKGNYVHGIKSGEWRNYDEKGKLTSIEQYDANGTLTTTIKQ